VVFYFVLALATGLTALPEFPQLYISKILFMQPHNNLLNRKQVAKYFEISFPTLKKLIDNGSITAYRLGKRKIYFKEFEIINSALKVIDSKKEANHE
jgi:excisionase family DNA binding protein